MEGLVKKIKGIRNEMIGLSIVLMLAGIFIVWLRILEIMRFLVHSDWFRALHWQALDCIF